MKRYISLGFEVAELRLVVDAARALCDNVRNHQLPTEDDEEHAITHISAMLSLVGCRMALITSALRGMVDPVMLSAEHNLVERPPSAKEGWDIVLQPWSLRERIEHAEVEVKRALAMQRCAKLKKGR